ncbi:MAG: HEAT repeat domain-containing protein [Peptostreptococcaceae bacterium]|nr:HEAT repeat domain-containing protein [Peptostreptococcaceae bacterium]
MNKIEELYLQNKTLAEIAEQLNLPIQTVEQKVIDFKMNRLTKEHQSTFLSNILILDKANRLDYLRSLSESDKNLLHNEVHDFFKIKKQNPEDVVLVIWLIGEMHFDEFTEILCRFTASKNGNIKRIVYSAMGKLQNERFIPYLKMGCKDTMIQVRMYAIKSLGRFFFSQKKEFFIGIYENETNERNKNILKELIGECVE